MPHSRLADIVVRAIEYFELVDDALLNQDTAVNYLESIAADLNEASDEERASVKAAAQRRLAYFVQPPDKDGYSPRLSPEHRRLLESVASGEAFGW